MVRVVDRVIQFLMLGLVLSVGLMSVPNAFAADNDLDGYDGLVDDCNDNDPNINPGATEIPGNDIDENCDEFLACFEDNDLDTYGSSVVIENAVPIPPSPLDECVFPGIANNNLDCDDSNPNNYPNAIEFCDGQDNNCDGSVDESDPSIGVSCDGADLDSCFEGVFECTSGALTCSDNTGDDVEVCDGVDNDCNGIVDDGLPTITLYPDQDQDGFGLGGLSQDVCEGTPIPPEASTNGLDCNDLDASINPDAIEVCDLVDNNCDGAVDEGGVCLVSCGDGIIDVGEQCDDSNTISGDGCNQSCQIECLVDADCSDPNYPVCGDDGFGGLACNSVGSIVCGNGVTESGEQCDDSNTISGDGCSATCLIEGTAQGQGSVDVLATCGLEIVSGNPINYGQLFPGAISDPEKTLVLDNTGNTEATLLVRGSQWTADDIDVMNVDATKYSILVGQDYTLDKIALTGSDEILDDTFDPVIDTESYWQLKADLLVDSFSGTATQTMDFTATC